MITHESEYARIDRQIRAEKELGVQLRIVFEHRCGEIDMRDRTTCMEPATHYCRFGPKIVWWSCEKHIAGYPSKDWRKL